MTDWSMALDNLAAAGVIDFDAPAFLLGKKPRYVGNPSMDKLPYSIPTMLPPGIKMKDIPQMDGFENQEHSNGLVEPPKWKKWLFGGLIATSVIVLACKTGIINKHIPQKFKDFANNCIDKVKTNFNKLITKFKKS